MSALAKHGGITAPVKWEGHVTAIDDFMFLSGKISFSLDFRNALLCLQVCNLNAFSVHLHGYNELLCTHFLIHGQNR
jgi:hypothetical protein